MTRMTLNQLGDGWYDSEESTRAGLVIELQRIRRRFAVRPLPVLLLAALITGGITYKIMKKQPLVEAEVILALSEGQVGATGHAGIPADQLREYVNAVLLPDKQLAAMIEKRHMYSLRKTLGMQFAIGELREQIEINIWKNSFQYYDDEDAAAKKSARIGITVMDKDPDQAFEVAHDLASIAIVQHEIERERISRAVTDEVKLMRAATQQRLSELDTAIAMKQAALSLAKQRGKNGLASALLLDLAALESQYKHASAQMSGISTSRDGIADQIAAASLDLSLQIVEERRPNHQERSSFVLVMILVVVGTGALIGAALFVGAFDSRIHDTDDVERLGLPVLGHVPGFAGDSVGSLQARGARRARVGSVTRWRSLR
ncbi:hypothetical protein BH11MYX3_BH11MYX3_43910 [soil metagenome]